MRISYALVLVATLAAPATAVAGDESLKQLVEKLAANYADNIAKQNPAGIAALYAKDGVLVINTGVQTDIAKAYEGTFKAGFNHDEITVDSASSLGPDTLIANGEFRLTGKSESEINGFCTATDVREGGTWKIKMLTAMPKAPPPQK
jgi:ketosteroid isomerase-like protein